MSGLFDIGKSGLTSYRQALAVTGQNIANINTYGYKRRNVELEEVSEATPASHRPVIQQGLASGSTRSGGPLMNFCLTRSAQFKSDAGSSTTFSKR